MNRIYIISLLVLMACTACQEATQTTAFTLDYGPVEFYFNGIIADEETSTPFDIEIGTKQIPGETDRYYLGIGLVDSPDGDWFEVNAFTNNFNRARSGRSRIHLQFWPDNIGTDDVWDKAEVQSYFAEDKVFTIGEQDASVFSFGILLSQYDTIVDSELSSNQFLANPTGEFTITYVEDYEYENYPYGVPTIIQGQIVRGTLWAEVGRYNLEDDQADGNPNYFRTDDVVTFEDGEVSFFVPYNEEPF